MISRLVVLMRHIVIYDVGKYPVPGAQEREYRICVVNNPDEHLQAVWRDLSRQKDVAIQRYALGAVNPTTQADSITLRQRIALRLHGEYQREKAYPWQDYVSCRGAKRHLVREFITKIKKFTIDDGTLFPNKKSSPDMRHPVGQPRNSQGRPYVVVYDTGTYFRDGRSRRDYRMHITDDLEGHLQEVRTEFSLRSGGQVHRFAYSQFTRTAHGFNPLEILQPLASKFNGTTQGRDNDPWSYYAEFAGPTSRQELRNTFIDHRFRIDDGDIVQDDATPRKARQAPQGHRLRPRHLETIAYLGLPPLPHKRRQRRL